MTTKAKTRKTSTKSKAPKTSKSDETFAAITQTIIESIEKGIADPKGWTAPWHKVGFLPTNATTQKAYKGGNVLALWAAQEKAGYPSAYWATYKQWQGVGAQVRGGEKGTLGIKWVVIDPKEGTDERRRIFPSVFSLFNAAQVDDWEAPAPTILTPTERDAKADKFFENVGAFVRYTGDSACYSPASDTITLPPHEQFKSADGFYATLAHEHVHWTGAKVRLDRDLTTRFGDAAYAAEELVAELGAAFLSAHLGVTTEPRIDHAQYLASWLKVLKADPRALFTAAGAAQKAVNFLIGLGEPEAETEIDSAATVVETGEKIKVGV